MIKTFIQYNSGKPIVGLRALKTDPANANALKLLAKAFDKGAPTSLGLTFDPKHITLEIATNLTRVRNGKS